MKVLGTFVGGAPDAANEGLRRALLKVNKSRAGVATVDDPASELVLARKCVDAAKVGYQLRCNGDRLSSDLLREFDDGLRGAVEETLGRGVEDDSWVQATLAVPAGGLGLREASALTLPAFIASRVAARAPVTLMAAHAEKAGVCSQTILMQHYDERTTAAVDNWLLELPGDLHAAVRDAVGEAARQGQSWWNSVTVGTVDPEVLAGEGKENVELEFREGSLEKAWLECCKPAKQNIDLVLCCLYSLFGKPYLGR